MSKTSNIKNRQKSTKTNFLLLLPIFLIVTVLPLIVLFKVVPTHLESYDWYGTQEYASDYFIYYKQVFLIIIASIMAIILLIRKFINKDYVGIHKTLLPLLVYTLLAIISTLFSKYRFFGIHGFIEQYENIFCIIGYTLIVYYIYLNIKNEYQLKMLIYAIATGAIILGIIGTLQLAGYDYFNNSFFRKIIYCNYPEYLNSDSSAQTRLVYTTMYNPNYVGVYTSTIITLFTLLIFYAKKYYDFIIYTAVVIFSFISLIGSQSKAGLVTLIVTQIILCFLMRKKIAKLWYVAIPILTAIILSFSLYNLSTDYKLVKKIKQSFILSKTPTPELSSINTLEDGISVEYKGDYLFISLDANHNLVLKDRNDNEVAYSIYATLEDGSLVIQPSLGSFCDVPIINNINASDETIDLCLVIDNKTWAFSKKYSKQYLYLNRFNKLSPIKTHTSNILKGYENFATKRGFIWQRSLPLLKDNIILGSGADSFPFVFPQHDYVSFYNNDYESEVISKPHSYYLQIAIQSGVLSLICILLFFGYYLVQSIRIFIKSKFNSYLEQVGLAFFLAIINYLITCITNDSSLVVTPIMWVIIGCGIVTNKLITTKSK